jgi:hypothetical protein
MNRLRAPLVSLVIVLTGCAGVSAFSPSDRPGQQTGRVTALQTIVQEDTEPLTVVFVHGVGDHCRGYAVGDQDNPKETTAAWLNDKATKRLGLVARSQKPDVQITAKELQIGAVEDETANVTLIRERTYLWTIPTRKTPLEVDAVEVTWSPMTRWIKNSLLGYDATKLTPIPFGYGGPAVDLCSYDTKEDLIGNETPSTPWFSPPARLTANGILKWEVLDRSLADALIYSGSYGEAMQRGMAAALCRVVGGSSNGINPCAWPATHDFSHRHFVFVTHSLGSRLLYDTLLNLSGSTTQAGKYPNLFPNGYVAASTPVIASVIDSTAGFYMMANQLTMLGIADVPTSAPFEEMQPYLFTQGLQPAALAPASTSKSQKSAAQTDPLIQLLKLRPKHQANIVKDSEKLAIVSFNDTNDLLTWHLPAWYADSGGDNSPGIEIADVFVKNARHWVDAVEWPPSAHDDYFTDKRVWGVIFCGAKNGAVTNCTN